MKTIQFKCISPNKGISFKANLTFKILKIKNIFSMSDIISVATFFKIRLFLFFMMVEPSKLFRDVTFYIPCCSLLKNTLMFDA